MPAAPVGRGRGATMPAWMTQCGAAPAWEGETFEVPAASMGNP